MIRTFDHENTAENLNTKGQIIEPSDSYLEIEYVENQGIRADTIKIKTPGLLRKLYDWIFQPELESDIVVYSSSEGNDDESPNYNTLEHAEYINHAEQITVRKSAFEAATSNEAELAAKAKQIQQALRDWQNAVAYFESVDDPSLIDFAVFDMEAAKRKYIYLLNSAKEIRHAQ